MHGHEGLVHKTKAETFTVQYPVINLRSSWGF